MPPSGPVSVEDPTVSAIACCSVRSCGGSHRRRMHRRESTRDNHAGAGVGLSLYRAIWVRLPVDRGLDRLAFSSGDGRCTRFLTPRDCGLYRASDPSSSVGVGTVLTVAGGGGGGFACSALTFRFWSPSQRGLLRLAPI